MSAITKFSFDKSFDPPEVSKEVEEEALPPEPTFSEAELEEARRAGFSDGHNAGAADAFQSIDNTVAQMLESIAAQLSTVAPMYRHTLERSHREAIEIARAITRKMVESVAADTAFAAIERTIASILPRVMDEPRIVVRVGDEILDTLQERMPVLAERCGFPGSLILLSEPGLSGSDCKVEWADGGAEHDTETLWTEIDELIERYLAGIGREDEPGPGEADAADAAPTENVKSEEHPNG